MDGTSVILAGHSIHNDIRWINSLGTEIESRVSGMVDIALADKVCWQAGQVRGRRYRGVQPRFGARRYQTNEELKQKIVAGYKARINEIVAEERAKGELTSDLKHPLRSVLL